jgi:hypothetical protein
MDIDPVMDSRLLLVELEARVEDNRRRAGVLRFPLIAIGVANLLAAIWCLLAGRDHLLVFYAPALAVVVLASRHHFRRMAERHGLLLPLRTWVLAACGLAIASAAVSRLGAALGAQLLEEVGPSLVWVLGYYLLGRWGRNRALMAATIVMLPSAAVLAAVTSGDALVAAQLAVNGALVIVAALSTAELA